jgi:hypothetical protein
LVGTYLLPKHEGTEAHIPTSATLYLTLLGDVLPTEQQGALAAAQTACAEARAALAAGLSASVRGRWF